MADLKVFIRSIISEMINTPPVGSGQTCVAVMREQDSVVAVAYKPGKLFDMIDWIADGGPYEGHELPKYRRDPGHEAWGDAQDAAADKEVNKMLHVSLLESVGAWVAVESRGEDPSKWELVSADFSDREMMLVALAAAIRAVPKEITVVAGEAEYEEFVAAAAQSGDALGPIADHAKVADYLSRNTPSSLKIDEDRLEAALKDIVDGM